MIFRIFLMFMVIAGATSGLLYLASCTDYFNADRLRHIARNAALAAVGALVAVIALALLVAVNA